MPQDSPISHAEMIAAVKRAMDLLVKHEYRDFVRSSVPHPHLAELRAVLAHLERTQWTGTKQRNDLKTCPFCDTKAVQQVRLANSDTEMQFRIGCGNPFCGVEPNTPPYAALHNAEEAWQERAAAAAEARRAAGQWHGHRYSEFQDQLLHKNMNKVTRTRIEGQMLAHNESAKHFGAIASPAPQEEKMNEDQIKHMVQRFLSWPLPKDFAPDGGITAKRPNYAPEVEWAPSGTNLLTATQAEAMVRHMLEGCP